MLKNKQQGRKVDWNRRCHGLNFIGVQVDDDGGDDVGDDGGDDVGGNHGNDDGGGDGGFDGGDGNDRWKDTSDNNDDIKWWQDTSIVKSSFSQVTPSSSSVS